MKGYISRRNAITFAVLLAVAAAGGAFVYETRSNMQTAATIEALNKQISTLTSALQGSNINPNTDQSLTGVISETAPAVVSIVITKKEPMLKLQYVNPFQGDPLQGTGIQVPVWKQVGTQDQEVGAGTGFFIRQDGYIITNRHVVSDTGATYTAQLSDGTKKVAQVVYRDPNDDMAIIKVEGTGYPTIPLGDSSGLELGQSVAAIGNALGEYHNSVSVGIVSGLNRTIQAGDQEGNVETLDGVIQTDVPINSGNSGGPLLDMNGNAVGINVAMESGANDISFSIPINPLKAAINKVLP